MKKGEPAEKIITNTTERYDSIAAELYKYVYFIIKNKTWNEESILNFIHLLRNQLMLTVSKKQLEMQTVFL